jgi:tetratricopeptide (TPR) repeat protein
MADNIKAVFLAALDTSIDQRPAYLDRACGRDAEARRRVEALLRAHEGTDPLLDRPAWGPTAEAHGPPAPAVGPIERAGRVHLLGEIARGGMGAVLRGHDPELGRELAVKVILPGHRANPELVRRFIGEARLAGQLQHPGIMPVYDVGQLPDGRPFFTMKLIQGRTLAELLAQRPDPGHDLPRFLRYFEAVCQAVGYAHSRGVIHRDLKPVNVMVGAFGEVQVMDWGLAKRLAEGFEDGPEHTPAPAFPSSTPVPAALTRPGAVIGTPGYLAPEQARGQTGDPRSDVFGLGAILCEMLTGAPPFRQAAPLDLLQQARAEDLTDATDRLGRCGAGPELVRLAEDCLRPEPAERPTDGSVVAARLADYLAGVQERLRRAEVGQARAEARAEGERTRRRLTVGLAAAVLTVVALGSGTVVLVQRHQAEQAREQARRQQAAETALAQGADLKQQGRWAEALAGLQQARQRLDERDGEVNHEVQRAAVELELVGRLEKVRLRAATWVLRTFASAKADREYEAEFRAAGLGGPDEPAEAVAKRVRASGIRAALVAALDAWAVLTDDRRRVDWTRAVARRADQGGGAWGRRLRASWADPAALVLLAHQAPVGRLSPHLLVALASALGNSREVVPFLRKAQAQYPGDFWLTFSLANRLFEEQRHAEAAGFYRAALAVRPDTSAVLVNLGLVLKAQNQLDEACDCYRRAIVLDPGSIYAQYAYYDLGNALDAKGQVDAAIVSYQRAIAIDPMYAWAYTNLGNLLVAKGQADAAIVSYRRAIAIDPKLALAHSGLGNALKAKGKLDAAIVSYQRAIALGPKYAPVHTNLGAALQAQGQLDAAIVSYQRAIAIDPKLPQPHFNLGLILYIRKDLEGAIASYRKAIALDPRDAKIYHHLGVALQDKGDLEGAIASYRRAAELQPKEASRHYALGTALSAKGDQEGAIASYKKAIALDPKHAQAHANLGFALHDNGDVEGAIASYMKAMALDPNLVQARYNLGTLWLEIKEWDRAAGCFRKAIAIVPSYAEAQCNLGLALMGRGDFAEALASLRRGHELGSKRPDWKHPSDKWVGDCEQLIEREKKLLKVLAGKRQPANPRERLAWAGLCIQTRRYVAAVRLLAEAFAAEPQLADDLKAGNRYHAAWAAALGAAGKDRDAAMLGDGQRANMRKQALAWLKADLAARAQQPVGERAPALRHWLVDKGLAGVRSEPKLRALPATERASWSAFWSDVRKYLSKP